MSNTSKNRFRATAVALAPLVLAAGFLYHPYIANLTDADAVAEAAASDTTRWGLSHLVVGVGSGFVVLAFLAIRSYLREAGEDQWSAPAVPLIVLGGTLYAILPGMEFATLAAIKTGADGEAAQAALEPWFFPLLMTAAVTYALGIVGFAIGIVRGGVLSSGLTWLVVVAFIVMAAARFVPLGAVQLYVQTVAVTLALWPLAFRMLEGPSIQSVRDARPAST